jgi:hypothetical protein
MLRLRCATLSMTDGQTRNQKQTMSASTTLRRALMLAALLPAAAHAQRGKAKPSQDLPSQLQYADYHWDEKRRQRLPISAEEATQPAVVLKDFTATEYYYDPARKDIRMFTTEHRIVRVNTADGIEQYNKLSVPVLPGGATIAVRARTISPKGEVVEVQPESMKELKNEAGAGGYRIFALDGVESGSEVEYYFTRERRMSHFGREIMQGGTPERDVTVELISPTQLTFEAKVYNFDAKVQRDTLTEGKRILRVQVSKLEAIHNEAFAAPKAHRARVEYKLAYTANKGAARQFTWSDASQAMHKVVYTLDKEDAKAVATVLKAANVPAGASPTERVAAVENYIKLNFNLDPSAGGELPGMVATHNASELGFVRLMGAALKTLGVEHELVINSDRSELPFDKDFDTWGYLDNFFFYLPATKQYLAPSRPDYRLGMVPAEWTGTPALFVKTVKLGAIESAVGTVHEVPALPATASPHSMAVQVKFAPDLDKATVHLRQEFGGYQGASLQTIYPLVPVDKQQELLLELQKPTVPDGKFLNTTAQNAERGLNILAKPFVVESDIESAGLLDKAGPRYLFKVGTLIGPQTELYQQDARQFDVENDFNREYSRQLVVELPAGYNMDVKAGTDPAAPVYYFRSSYKQDGQKLVINSTEAYQQIFWPKKDFEAYRAVVNASANFNKVVLVLEKK